MPCSRRTVVVGLSATALLLARRTEAAAPTLRFAFCENCLPFCGIRDDQPTGLLIDLVGVIVGQAGYNINYEPRPWKRAQLEVQQGKLDFFCTVMTNERQTYAYFIQDPVISLTYGAVHRLDFKAEQINSLDALMNLRQINYIGHGWAEHNLDRSKIKWVPSHETAVKLVAANRADVFVVDNFNAEPLIHRLGFSETLAVTPLAFLEPAPYRLGLSQRLPYLAVVKERLAHSLHDHRAKLDAIIAKHFRD